MKKKGKELANLSNFAAVPMLTPMLDRYSALEKIQFNTSDWDLLVSIAICKMGIQFAPMHDLGMRRFRKFCNSVVVNLPRSNPSPEDTLTDLHGYIEMFPQAKDDAEIFLAVIGNWVVINLKGDNQLTEQEMELGRIIGMSCYSHVKDFW